MKEKKVTKREVILTIVNQVLLPHDFQIVSVNHPASSKRIFISLKTKSGKNKKKLIVDVIALLPRNVNSFDVLLVDVGNFSSRRNKKADGKLCKFRTNIRYKKALKKALIKDKVFDERDELEKIFIGVGLSTLTKKKPKWSPKETNFIFRLESREKWSIGIFRQELCDLIKTVQGETNFPAVYKVKKKKTKPKNKPNNKNLPLFDKND